MKVVDSNDLPRLLRQLHARSQQGDSSCLLQLQELAAQWPNEPNVAHLCALAHKSFGYENEAEKYFVLSLRLDDQQAQVHNNFANFLKALKQHERADVHYRNALVLEPGYVEALQNYAMNLIEQKFYEEAISELNLWLRSNKANAVVLTLLADTYRHLEKHDVAITWYQKAITLDSSRPLTWHNLALSLYLDGKLADALPNYLRAYELMPTVDTAVSCASAMHDAGRASEALTILDRQLQRDPTNVILHDWLSKIRWEIGEKESFITSYQVALSSGSADEELWLSYLTKLMHAGRIEQAQSELKLALARYGKTADLLATSAKLEAECGNYEVAQALFSRSLGLRQDVSVLHDSAKLALIMDDYERAQKLTDQILSQDPHCQIGWAYQAQVWKKQDIEKYRWLYNYDVLLRSYELTCPSGYSSLECYLQDLEKTLLALHHVKTSPLDQSLSNGTQTAPKLLSIDDQVVVTLKKQLTAIVTNYISTLPTDQTHPFLRRKSDAFVFSGSWSVKLLSQGFHVNHVHPQGWLSSSFYVSVPQSCRQADDNAGAIKFGQATWQTGNVGIDKIIEPKPAMVLLFPSYVWHGTCAFESDENDFRLTAPFDVFPVLK